MEEEHEFYVAGVKFHDINKVSKYLKKGIALRLEPDPDNEYDPNAVKIIFGPAVASTMLGFVPQKKGEMSATVSAMLTWCDSVICDIVEYEPDAPPYKQLLVRVKGESKGDVK